MNHLCHPLKQKFPRPLPENKQSESIPKRLVNPPEITPSKMTLKKNHLRQDIAEVNSLFGSWFVFCSNMMYSHTMTVYDRNFKLVKTIPGYSKLVEVSALLNSKAIIKVLPVEAAFSTDGKYAYVSNYQMYGLGLAIRGATGALGGQTRPKFPVPYQYPNFENRKSNSCRCCSEI